MVAVGLPQDPTVIAGAPPLMLALKKVLSSSQIVHQMLIRYPA
jgi:hypothetical protein